MELEQAQRLLDNEDFKAFMVLLDTDSKQMAEDLVYHTDPVEIMRTQCKIQVLRGVQARLNHVVTDLKPEEPVSAQDSVSLA